ncbi:MAG: phasin family protein [Proteobacteria bacterium]|nr:phasin family protein [Pseudomonadota bacterium]
MDYTSFGNFETMSKTAAESAKKLESINTSVFEKLTKKNMDLFNSTIELNNKFVAMLGEAKGVQELFNEQLQLTTEYNGKVFATIKEATEIVVNSKDDYQSWLEAGIKTVVPTAAKSTKKAA